MKNTLDADVALSLVETKPAGGSYATRAGSFTYNPAGAVTSMQLGNGRWESTQFNNRLQPTQIALGTTQNATDLLKLNYSYGTTDNNGNVQSQTVTVPGVAHAFVQAYTYDLLNRLKSAEEAQNGAQVWKQTFTFDRYGNRNFDAANTTTLGSCPTAVCNPTVNTANNRFNTGQGYSYDSAGNTTADAEGRTFVYDAENKQVSVSNSGGTIGQYFYDGDGKRVRKTATGDNTVFVYDASGQLIEERNASTAVLQTTYVYAGSRRLSTETASGTSYLTSDHLGSPRINTNQSGTVTARHDYHPFGEEISRSGYGSDTVRQQFTGYERDIESELDYAQMRMYAKLWGRFTSPDRQNAGSDIRLPQSWNGYTYVLNNPLNLTDPNGLIWLRLNGTDSYTWVDDDVYKKNKGDYKNYTPANNAIIKVTGGREAEKDPALIGQNVVLSEQGPGAVYTISDDDLASGTVFAPAEPIEMSPMHQLIAGAENKTLWFWRPVVYGMTACMLPAAIPVTGGGSAAGGAILTLGLRAAPAIPTGVAALNQLLNQAQNISRPNVGWTQLTTSGNAQQIFDNIAQGGQRLASGAVQMSDGRVVHLYPSTTPGPYQGLTIQVQSATGYITKVRITP